MLPSILGARDFRKVPASEAGRYENEEAPRSGELSSGVLLRRVNPSKLPSLTFAQGKQGELETPAS